METKKLKLVIKTILHKPDVILKKANINTLYIQNILKKFIDIILILD